MALRLKMATIVAAVLLALLAVAAVAQVASASSIGYSCIVPRFGSTQCGNQFYVARGKSLYVFLNTSGGKRVDFTTYDAGTGGKYGNTRFLSPGQHKLLWTNRTRSGQYVYVRASSPSTVRVQAVGHYDHNQ